MTYLSKRAGEEVYDGYALVWLVVSPELWAYVLADGRLGTFRKSDIASFDDQSFDPPWRLVE